MPIDGRSAFLYSDGYEMAVGVETVNEPYLTPAELQVLQLTADGLTDQQVGERIGIAWQTVRHHQTAIRRRLGALTRAQAVAIALREGLIR